MINVGGVILAGGLSSRMGHNKALLPYGPHRLIDHMQALLIASGLSPLHISGESHGLTDCIPDSLPRSGPVSGICSFLLWAKSTTLDGWVFVPVDMPLLSPPLLRDLTLTNSTNTDAAHYKTSPLPLLLWNKPHVIKHTLAMAALLSNGQSLSVRQFLQPLLITHIPLNNDKKTQLTNINTPEEWEAVKITNLT